MQCQSCFSAPNASPSEGGTEQRAAVFEAAMVACMQSLRRCMHEVLTTSCAGMHMVLTHPTATAATQLLQQMLQHDEVSMRSRLLVAAVRWLQAPAASAQRGAALLALLMVLEQRSKSPFGRRAVASLLVALVHTLQACTSAVVTSASRIPSPQASLKEPAGAGAQHQAVADQWQAECIVLTMCARCLDSAAAQPGACHELGPAAAALLPAALSAIVALCSAVEGRAQASQLPGTEARAVLAALCALRGLASSVLRHRKHLAAAGWANLAACCTACLQVLVLVHRQAKDQPGKCDAQLHRPPITAIIP